MNLLQNLEKFVEGGDEKHIIFVILPEQRLQLRVPLN